MKKRLIGAKARYLFTSVDTRLKGVVIRYKNLQNSQSLRHSSSLLFILNYLNISIPDDALPLIHFSNGVFILSLVCFLSFTNVILYFLSIIVLRYYKDQILNKYPKLIKFFQYFEKSRLGFIIIEVILCYLCLIILIISSLSFLSIYIV